MRLFRVPAAFAKANNYPIIRETEAPAGRPAERVASRTDTKEATAVPPGDEHVVTAKFTSLLGGSGSRRTVVT
ncbi:MAG TPA: hypothetical protein VLJ37_10440 [bacterium]|nr:hypothetical protein [bacterium]